MNFSLKCKTQVREAKQDKYMLYIKRHELKIVSYHNAKGVEKWKAQQRRFSLYVHELFSLCSNSTSANGVIAYTSHFNLI